MLQWKTSKSRSEGPGVGRASLCSEVGRHRKKREAEGQKPTDHHVNEEEEGNGEKQRETLGKYQIIES